MTNAMLIGWVILIWASYQLSVLVLKRLEIL